LGADNITICLLGKIAHENKQLKLMSLIWAKHVGEWRKMGNKITNLEHVMYLVICCDSYYT